MGEPKYQYYDIQISNPEGNPNKIAEFIAACNEPILNIPSDYEMAVVNFQCPLQSLPLLIFPVTPGNADPNLGSQIVGVTHNVDPSTVPNVSVPTNFPINLEWVPQTYGLAVPSQLNQTHQVVTPYYYCFSIQYYLTILNTALYASFVAAGSPGGSAPYFFFDTTASPPLIKLLMPEVFVNAAGATYGWSVFWNIDLDEYLSSFSTIQNGSMYIVNNRDAFIGTNEYSYDNSRIALWPFVQNTPPSTKSGTLTQYIYSQESPTSDYMNSVRKLIIVTGSIPIVSEFFPRAYDQNSSNANKLKILVDFNLDFQNNIGAQRSIAIYQPQIYERLDLISSQPLRQIDARVQWLDSNNNAYDIYLSKFDVITIKLGFFRKDDSDPY